MTLKCKNCETGILKKCGDPKQIRLGGILVIDQLYKCNKCSKHYGHRCRATSVPVLGNKNPEEIKVEKQ